MSALREYLQVFSWRLRVPARGNGVYRSWRLGVEKSFQSIRRRRPSPGGAGGLGKSRGYKDSAPDGAKRSAWSAAPSAPPNPARSDAPSHCYHRDNEQYVFIAGDGTKLDWVLASEVVSISEHKKNLGRPARGWW